jgi:hypothetical protein
MTKDDYRRALDAAIREYEALGEERQRIDKRLAEVMQTIGSLSRLCGLVSTVPLGLTDACRLVIRGAGVPVTAMEVRDRIAAIGFDLSRYVNDLAAIHTILKRLNESGELRLLPRGPEPGKHAYLWNSGPSVVSLGSDIAAFRRDMTFEREAMHAENAAASPSPRSKRRTSARRSPR